MMPLKLNIASFWNYLSHGLSEMKDKIFQIKMKTISFAGTDFQI